ncbi:MAG: hypothetical protein P1V51_22360 [Deltaproteobacteria bacterium]|nr:hypothetical protein [Deltaproteobacteria bacterium]
MIGDAKNKLSNNQALAGTSVVQSTDVYNAGAALDLGAGGRPKAFTRIEDTPTGTSPTLQVEFCGYDDEARTTGKVVFGHLPAAARAKDDFLEVPIASTGKKKRWYGFEYLQGGTTPVHNVTSGLALDLQQND